MFRSRRGFTLIELLVVISIISLLSSVVLSSLNSARTKARDIFRKQSILQVQKALAQYYSDNGSFPTGYYGTFAWATQWSPLLGSQYIKSMPVDPQGWFDSGHGCDSNGDDLTTRGMFYVGSSDGQHYFMGTSVETMPASTDPHYFYYGTTQTYFAFSNCVSAVHWFVQQ
ncbi:MAG TPA: prepilin-type N-terminal cleavage/methylation domain-containing protein [Candidatus Paceibacterota bacterium]|nr:prepilin-type N-terminal cleavage/methylation domain-containing protein [Candidatus Paceibacterota bacterium]